MRQGLGRRISMLEKPVVVKENKIPDYIVFPK